MNAMGGSELSVIGKLVNGIDILIMIIMSNQRNQISITDGKRPEIGSRTMVSAMLPRRQTGSFMWK